MSDVKQDERLRATDIACRIFRTIPRPSGERIGQFHVMHNVEPTTKRERWLRFERHCFDAGLCRVWYWTLVGEDK